MPLIAMIVGIGAVCDPATLLLLLSGDASNGRITPRLHFVRGRGENSVCLELCAVRSRAARFGKSNSVAARAIPRRSRVYSRRLFERAEKLAIDIFVIAEPALRLLARDID